MQHRVVPNDVTEQAHVLQFSTDPTEGEGHVYCAWGPTSAKVLEGHRWTESAFDRSGLIKSSTRQTIVNLGSSQKSHWPKLDNGQMRAIQHASTHSAKRADARLSERRMTAVCRADLEGDTRDSAVLGEMLGGEDSGVTTVDRKIQRHTWIGAL